MPGAELSQEKKLEVVDYISQARGEGGKDKDIKKAMLDAGWREEQIAPFFPESRKLPIPFSITTLVIAILALISFSVTGLLIYLAARW